MDNNATVPLRPQAITAMQEAMVMTLDLAGVAVSAGYGLSETCPVLSHAALTLGSRVMPWRW